MRRPWRRRAQPQPLSCREVVELVTDYLDGALNQSERERFENHLTSCDPCVAYIGQIRATAAVAARIGTPGVDPDTFRHLVDLYRQWQQPPTG